MKSTYRALYRLGVMPWRRIDIPAAVRDVVAGPGALPAGRAVDLGCGTGEQARYLAAQGWQVTAVDYIPAAITAARRLDPHATVTWRVADVTRIEQITRNERLIGLIGLILDDRCLHGIAPADWLDWAHTVTALAAPDATLLVHAAPAGRRGRIGVPAGINHDDITELLGHAWRPADQTHSPRPDANWHRYIRR